MSYFSNWKVYDVEAHNAKVRESRAPKAERPLLKASACDEESVLHDKIIGHCRANGWLYFHGSMAKATARTRGEPDFTIIAPSRVYFIECKRANGKLSPDQNAVIAMAARLGTTIHVVRSYEEFLEIVKDKPEQKDLIP